MYICTRLLELDTYIPFMWKRPDPTCSQPLPIFMNSSRSLRKLQYNPNNINQDLRITSQPELPYYGFHLGIGTGPSETPVNVTMRSQAGMSGLTEAENGACFLQLTPAASQFRPGPIILPPQPVQNNFHHGITTSISLDRQPTLFTKDASPQRKAAELNNVLGDTSGRLDSKAKVIPSDLGNLKRPKSAPSSPVILLEQAKSRARVELDLLLDSGSCVEGGYVKGRVLVNVRVPHKKEGPIYLGEGKVRVVGFEGDHHASTRTPTDKRVQPFHRMMKGIHSIIVGHRSTRFLHSVTCYTHPPQTTRASVEDGKKVRVYLLLCAFHSDGPNFL